MPTKATTDVADAPAPAAPGMFAGVELGTASVVPSIKRGRSVAGPSQEVLYAREVLEKSQANRLAATIPNITVDNREEYARTFRKAADLEPVMKIRTVLDKTTNILYVGPEEVIAPLIPPRKNKSGS